MRWLVLVFAAITLSATGSPQELRGSSQLGDKLNGVPQPLQLIEYNNPVPKKVHKTTHAPPVWVGASDIVTPGLAWIALLGMPLVLIPCMVRCKNGNLDKLF